MPNVSKRQINSLVTEIEEAMDLIVGLLDAPVGDFSAHVDKPYLHLDVIKAALLEWKEQ